jgi:mannose-6-phosphate isomerase-like protein (cupin superfamily)
MSTADDEIVVLEPGMSALFAPGEAHATKNEGNEEVLSLVITSPPLG